MIHKCFALLLALFPVYAIAAGKPHIVLTPDYLRGPVGTVAVETMQCCETANRHASEWANYFHVVVPDAKCVNENDQETSDSVSARWEWVKPLDMKVPGTYKLKAIFSIYDADPNGGTIRKSDDAEEVFREIDVIVSPLKDQIDEPPKFKNPSGKWETVSRKTVSGCDVVTTTAVAWNKKWVMIYESPGGSCGDSVSSPSNIKMMTGITGDVPPDAAKKIGVTINEAPTTGGISSATGDMPCVHHKIRLNQVIVDLRTTRTTGTFCTESGKKTNSSPLKIANTVGTIATEDGAFSNCFSVTEFPSGGHQP